MLKVSVDYIPVVASRTLVHFLFQDKSMLFFLIDGTFTKTDDRNVFLAVVGLDG